MHAVFLIKCFFYGYINGMLVRCTHLGGTNLDFMMDQYVYKCKSGGVYIINLSVISLAVVAGKTSAFVQA